MSFEYFDHITTLGDRWDLIAYKYYGDATRIIPLLRANPNIIGDINTPTPLIFKKGVIIRVPAIDKTEIQASQLPPWKRGAK